MRTTLLVILLSLLAWLPAQADRFSGNINATYSRQFDNDEFEGYSLQQQQASLFYEDILFYKNRMLLGVNVFRSQQERSSAYTVRPIYTLDLTSYGYSWRSSYSPYQHKQALFPGEARRIIYTREVRNVLSILYPKYPSLSLAYRSAANFDRQPVRGIDTHNKNFLAQAGYGISNVTASLSYNRVDLVNNLPQARDRRLETYSAAANATKDLARFVSLSSGYSYYDTKSQVPDVGAGAQTSKVHAVTALASTRQFHKFSALASYSGNFLMSSIASLQTKNSTQALTGQIGFYPASYASLEMLKSYQITDEAGTLLPLEYLSFTGNLTRYLRRGVTTRLSVSRTIYQQSDRAQLEAGPVSEKYITDTYYGSLGFGVTRRIKLLTDMSIGHTDRPLEVQQRYNVQRLMMAQFAFSRTVDGRVTANWASQGATLDLFRSQSINYNYGLSWTPNSSITATMAYSYSTGQALAGAKYSSLGGYVGYSYRRAFVLSASVNQQNTEQIVFPEEGDSFLWKARPTNVNTSLTVYVTKKITGTVGYAQSKTPRLDKRDLRASSLQATVNIRL